MEQRLKVLKVVQFMVEIEEEPDDEEQEEVLPVNEEIHQQDDEVQEEQDPDVDQIEMPKNAYPENYWEDLFNFNVNADRISEIAIEQLQEFQLQYEHLKKIVDESYMHSDINDEPSVNRDLYCKTIILSWNINGTNAHKLQFYSVYNQEKLLCVIINEHLMPEHSRPMIPGMT